MSLQEAIVEMTSGKKRYGMLVSRGSAAARSSYEFICNSKLVRQEGLDYESIIEQLPLSDIKAIDVSLK